MVHGFRRSRFQVLEIGLGTKVWFLDLKGMGSKPKLLPPTWATLGRRLYAMLDFNMHDLHGS